MKKYALTAALFILCLFIPYWLTILTWEKFALTYLAYWFFADFLQGGWGHKWAAHKYFHPPKWAQYVFGTLATATLQGSPLGWALWHRTHHKYSDTERDPHSPKYHSAFYIVGMQYLHKINNKMAPDLLRDKYIVWLTNNELYLVIGASVTAYLILGLEWFTILWAVPIALAKIIVGYIINVRCHTPVLHDSWLSWPFMFGGAWHKRHHDGRELFNSKFGICEWLFVLFGWAKYDLKEHK